MPTLLHLADNRIKRRQEKSLVVSGDSLLLPMVNGVRWAGDVRKWDAAQEDLEEQSSYGRRRRVAKREECKSWHVPLWENLSQHATERRGPCRCPTSNPKPTPLSPRPRRLQGWRARLRQRRKCSPVAPGRCIPQHQLPQRPIGTWKPRSTTRAPAVHHSRQYWAGELRRGHGSLPEGNSRRAGCVLETLLAVKRYHVSGKYRPV